MSEHQSIPIPFELDRERAEAIVMRQQEICQDIIALTTVPEIPPKYDIGEVRTHVLTCYKTHHINGLFNSFE